DLALGAELDAFVKPLRQSHGASYAEAQLARGILLKFAGGERRRRTAAALFLLYAPHRPLRLLQLGADGICRLLAADFKLVAGQADITGIEIGGLGTDEIGIHGPVFLLLESLDLALAVHDQAQSNGLHSPGRDAAADFIPQQRRDLVADDSVKHAPRLLRVDEIAVNVARLLECIQYGALGDFIEGHAADQWAAFLLLGFLSVNAIATQFFRQVRSDGLAFAVRIRREINRRGGFRHLLQPG